MREDCPIQYDLGELHGPKVKGERTGEGTTLERRMVQLFALQVN